jgi:hypothetical protein
MFNFQITKVMRPTNNILKYSVIVFLLTLLSCNDECPEPVKPETVYVFTTGKISETDIRYFWLHDVNEYMEHNQVTISKCFPVDTMPLDTSQGIRYYILIFSDGKQVSINYQTFQCIFMGIC